MRQVSDIRTYICFRSLPFDHGFAISRGEYILHMRTMWDSAIWKYSPDHAVRRAVDGKRQGFILVLQTQASPLSDDLTAGPAFTSVMSPALHAVADDCWIDDSSAP